MLSYVFHFRSEAQLHQHCTSQASANIRLHTSEYHRSSQLLLASGLFSYTNIPFPPCIVQYYNFKQHLSLQFMTWRAPHPLSNAFSNGSTSICGPVWSPCRVSTGIDHQQSNSRAESTGMTTTFLKHLYIWKVAGVSKMARDSLGPLFFTAG